MAQGLYPLFVTHLSTESNLVCLWGQINSSEVIDTERTLATHISSFTQHVTDLRSVIPGLRCYVHNEGGRFIRVKVVSVNGSTVHLQSIDYGFQSTVDVRDLRLPLVNDPLIRKPDAAESYFVANVQTYRRLNEAELSTLRQGVVGQNLMVNVISAIDGNVKLAVFFKGNQDIRSNWLKWDLVGEIASALQENMIRTHLGLRNNVSPIPNTSVPPPAIPRPATVPAPPSFPSSLVHNPELIKALVEGVRGQFIPTEELHYPAPVVSIAILIKQKTKHGFKNCWLVSENRGWKNISRSDQRYFSWPLVIFSAVNKRHRIIRNGRG